MSDMSYSKIAYMVAGGEPTGWAAHVPNFPTLRDCRCGARFAVPNAETEVAGCLDCVRAMTAAEPAVHAFSVDEARAALRKEYIAEFAASSTAARPVADLVKRYAARVPRVADAATYRAFVNRLAESMSVDDFRTLLRSDDDVRQAYLRS